MNRLDLNVLADYRWPRFLEAAPRFVEQVGGCWGSEWGWGQYCWCAGVVRPTWHDDSRETPLANVADSHNSPRLHRGCYCSYKGPAWSPRAALTCHLLLAATLLQVPGDQDIADFLSALEDSSTAGLGGIYASALPVAAEEQQAQAAAAVDGRPAAAPAVPAGSKVQAVCATVRAALEQRDKVRRLPIAHPGGGVGGMELRIAGMLLSHAA